MLHELTGPTAAASLALAILLAGVTGLVIQHGGICLVAAVDEFVTRRRLNLVFGLFEAAVVVTAILAIAMQFGVRLEAEPDFEFMAPMLAGGVLLGLGALLNRACLFGTIAHLGSGDWHYLFTPVGFFSDALPPAISYRFPSRKFRWGRTFHRAVWLSACLCCF